jgi:hypothetical protein
MAVRLLLMVVSVGALLSRLPVRVVRGGVAAQTQIFSSKDNMDMYNYRQLLPVPSDLSTICHASEVPEGETFTQTAIE